MKFRFSFTLAMATACLLSLGCVATLVASEKGLKKIANVFSNNDIQGSVNNGSDEEATVKKTVTITDFSKIEASRAIKVILIPGKFNGKAEIATTESAAPYLKVSVSDNCLKIRYEGTFSSIHGPSIVTVQTDKFTSASLSSAASLEVKGALKTKRLSFDLSSAANVSLGDVACDVFDVELSSASKLSAGVVKSDETKIDISSAAHADIDMVKGGDLDIDSSSASHAVVSGFDSPDGKLDADASSAATIKVTGIKCRSVSGEASSGAGISFLGTCKTLSKETSSGGSVRASGLKSNRTD